MVVSSAPESSPPARNSNRHIPVQVHNVFTTVTWTRKTLLRLIRMRISRGIANRYRRTFSRKAQIALRSQPQQIQLFAY